MTPEPRPVVTSPTSDFASRVMARSPSPAANDRIERAAQAAYEAHHIGITDAFWADLPDWRRERWRWAARAVLMATASK
ncbi:MAG: hypothetical protein WBA46_19495 [Thermomicrobiales bacterium]